MSTKFTAHEKEYQRQYIAKKRAAGLCLRCLTPAVIGQSLCEAHRSYESDIRKKHKQEGRCSSCCNKVDRKGAMCSHCLEVNRYARLKRIADGICTRCGAKAENGLKVCAKCSSETNKYGNAKRARNIANGVCSFCGKPVVDGLQVCQHHRQKGKAAFQYCKKNKLCTTCRTPVKQKRARCERCSAKYYATNKTRVEERRKNGLCIWCGDPSFGFGACARCRERVRQRQLAFKLEVMNAYGGPICRCCSENHLEFLTLEHPNGDGEAHRRSLDAEKGGVFFHKKLKKLGFPQEPKMIVLCLNCNVSKGLYGICVHERERRALTKSNPLSLVTNDDSTSKGDDLAIRPQEANAPNSAGGSAYRDSD